MRIQDLGYLSVFSAATAVYININANDFAYISSALLKDSLPKIISDPSSLSGLLRIKETYEYGIAELISTTCPLWPLEVWKRIRLYVKIWPKLVFQLVTLECLCGFSLMNRQTNLSKDPGFQKSYNLALGLYPFPLELDSEEEVELLLTSIRLAPKFELGGWMSQNPFSIIINVLYNNNKVLNSGITRHFLFPKTSKDLGDLNSRTCYSSMLDDIKEPEELFGHAAGLKSILNSLESSEDNEYEREIIEFLRVTLQNLENRLLYVQKDENRNQSIEEICYLIHSSSKEWVMESGEQINYLLQNDETCNFQRLVEAAAWKLGDDFEKFLSRENCKRLLNLPSLPASFIGRVFDLDERINYYHRWMRRLPAEYPFIHPDFDPADYISGNFNQLPLHLDKMSLDELLDFCYFEIFEEALLQLEIVTKEGFTYINVKKGVDVESLLTFTFDFIRISVARQIYLRSSERFEIGLLGLLKQIRFNENDLGLHALTDAVQILYPCFCQ